jgi:hypothetical protein
MISQKLSTRIVFLWRSFFHPQPFESLPFSSSFTTLDSIEIWKNYALTLSFDSPILGSIHSIISGRTSNSLSLWDLKTKKELFRKRLDIKEACFAKGNGNEEESFSIFLLNPQGKVYLYDILNTQTIHVCSDIAHMEKNPSGGIYAFSMKSQQLFWFNPQGKITKTFTFPCQRSQIDDQSYFAASPSGQVQIITNEKEWLIFSQKYNQEYAVPILCSVMKRGRILKMLFISETELLILLNCGILLYQQVFQEKKDPQRKVHFVDPQRGTLQAAEPFGKQRVLFQNEKDKGLFTGMSMSFSDDFLFIHYYQNIQTLSLSKLLQGEMESTIQPFPTLFGTLEVVKINHSFLVLGSKKQIYIITPQRSLNFQRFYPSFQKSCEKEVAKPLEKKEKRCLLS